MMNLWSRMIEAPSVFYLWNVEDERTAVRRALRNKQIIEEERKRAVERKEAEAKLAAERAAAEETLRAREAERRAAEEAQREEQRAAALPPPSRSRRHRTGS